MCPAAFTAGRPAWEPRAAAAAVQGLRPPGAAHWRWRRRRPHASVAAVRATRVRWLPRALRAAAAGPARGRGGAWLPTFAAPLRPLLAALSPVWAVGSGAHDWCKKNGSNLCWVFFYVTFQV